MPVYRRSRTTNTRKTEYARSREKGIIMVIPCSRCSEKNYECRVLPGSDQCGECRKSGMEKICNVFGYSADAWARVDNEEKRLRAEHEKFQREEEEVAAKIQEASAKMLRLRIQARQTQSKLDSLREKAGKMLQYDFKTIEELDAFEELERLEQERQEREQAVAGTGESSSSVVDPSFELSSISPSEVAAWLGGEGSFGGTSLNQMGSSSCS